MGDKPFSQLQKLQNRHILSGVGNMSNPQLWGSQLIYKGEKSIDIYSQYNNRSCLLLWTSDHFGDGWDIAVLTVVAPDGSNDTFYPSCDQTDPFRVRYCPFQIQDEGVYTIKVFAPTQARFFWEISWQVYVESTGQWYKGDFSTKMKFYFDELDRSFSFFDAENLIYMDQPCYPCTTVSNQLWADNIQGG